MHYQSGISKVSGVPRTQILFNVQNQMSVSIKLGKNFAGATTENGRKIVKAGTPLTGDLTKRSTPFTAASGNDAVGVLLHDVDVTEYDANGSLLIWGFVNLDRVDATTKGKLTGEVQDALSGKVYFLSDN
jgi:hypothetical protein